MATHSSILAWKITRTENPGRLELQRDGHDSVKSSSMSDILAGTGRGGEEKLETTSSHNPPRLRGVTPSFSPSRRS